MKVVIFTSGRFHVCDLSRELDALGHEVAFYSCVPRSRTRRFGLPDICNHCLFWYVAPLFFWMRHCRGERTRRIGEQVFIEIYDRLASKLIRQCDVFIGMSGMSTLTATSARRRFGARIWIERGSRHILSQKEILENIPGAGTGAKPVSDFSVRRELADYALADIIVIPSKHVEQSFEERGTDHEKLFRISYGVDIEMFPPTPPPRTDTPTILTVGTWSLRKGSDTLTDAWRSLPGTRLIHVGSVLDVPLPTGPLFEHFGAVPQMKLSEFYARAHVFALASREEGLAVVQAQALACGLPIVCTSRTGGEDLQEFVEVPESISVVPPDSPAALSQAIGVALRLPKPSGVRDLMGSRRSRASWRWYGQQYSTALNTAFRSSSRLEATQSPDHKSVTELDKPKGAPQ